MIHNWCKLNYIFKNLSKSSYDKQWEFEESDKFESFSYKKIIIEPFHIWESYN